METISLFKGWMEDNISPCDWSNDKKFHNYLAVVSLDDDGNETRTYSDISDESDLYFNVSKLKVGDIVVVGCFNKYKKRTVKKYYNIIAKDTESITFSDDYTTYRKAYKTKKIHLDRFEDEEEYDEIFFSVIPNIQNAIETSIRNGEWYKSITFEIEELKDYDDKTIDNIIDDIFNYGGAHLQNDGFNVGMKFNGYVLTYYITVDTDVNQGHLDYHLMDKLLTNNYLQDINVVRRYIKMFNQYNSVIRDDNEFVVIDNEQKVKVTFYIGDWGRWEHTMERMEN